MPEEVAPDPYLTPDQVRERVGRSASESPLASLTDTYLAELVAEFEEIVEDYRGAAWVPRTATELVEVASPTSHLWLSWPLVRSVTSVTINGSAVASGNFTVVKSSGMVILSTTLATPDYPATVVYSHGADAPSAVLKRATALYVECVATSEKSGQGRDIITQAIDGGTTRYSTPSKEQGRPTGWLEVDRLLNSLPDFRSPLVH